MSLLRRNTIVGANTDPWPSVAEALGNDLLFYVDAKDSTYIREAGGGVISFYDRSRNRGTLTVLGYDSYDRDIGLIKGLESQNLRHTYNKNSVEHRKNQDFWFLVDVDGVLLNWVFSASDPVTSNNYMQYYVHANGRLVIRNANRSISNSVIINTSAQSNGKHLFHIAHDGTDYRIMIDGIDYTSEFALHANWDLLRANPLHTWDYLPPENYLGSLFATAAADRYYDWNFYGIARTNPLSSQNEALFTNYLLNQR